MPKFTFQMGYNARCYGSVGVEADTIDQAVAMLTADYVGENVEETERTWDSLTGLAIIDVSDEDGNAIHEDYAGTDLPSEYDPTPADPDGISRHSAETLQRAEEAFPISDWQFDVANGDTRLGYEAWLAHQIDAGGLDALETAEG